MAPTRILKRGPAGLLGLLLLVGCSPTAASTDTTQAVMIDGQSFELELALDDASRAQGLSGRASIATDGGMLFVFPEAEERVFWMRGCLVPIDIVFLGPGGRVVAMHRMQVESADTPDEAMTRYPSRYPAQFALEFAGGTLDRLALEEGDRVDLPLAALKARAE